MTQAIPFWAEAALDGHLKQILSCQPFVQVNAIGAAEWIVHPHLVMGLTHADALKRVKTSINISKLANTPLLIFLVTDIEDPFWITDCEAIIYRIGLTHNRRLKNEFPLPYVWAKHSSDILIVEKTDKPIIGFCGFAKAHPLRTRTLRYFEQDARFDTKFIFRGDTFGNIPDKESIIADFERNILECQFVVCDRGQGNFAIRMYQTLALGRIPIFIDSNMVMPRMREGSWADTTVSAPHERELADRVMECWRGDIVKKQYHCYDLFQKNLSDHGFSTILQEDLKIILNDKQKYFLRLSDKIKAYLPEGKIHRLLAKFTH